MLVSARGCEHVSKKGESKEAKKEFIDFIKEASKKYHHIKIVPFR